MAGWGVWHWRGHDRDAIDLGFVDAPFTGSFEVALLSARGRRTLKLAVDEHHDLKHRLEFSAPSLLCPRTPKRSLNGSSLPILLICSSSIAPSFQPDGDVRHVRDMRSLSLVPGLGTLESRTR